jgi:peptidyl-prolyl cis-trans isomerase A (cyclophilin A)
VIGYARLMHRALIRFLRLLTLAALLPAAITAAAPRAGAGEVRVRLETSAGPIVVAVDPQHAPITAGNFLRYVDEKRFDGMTFYRAARNRNNPKTGLVQGGNNHWVRRSLAPIAHEPTSRTGLRHVDGTLSMARNAPGTAMGDFFITVGPAPYLDARPGYPGYAAFGHVVSGMATVSRILALPTFPGGYSAETIGQSIREPVRILTARRVR